MNTRSTRATLVREAVGLGLMIVSGVFAISFLITVAGIGATVVMLALIALMELGRWLASGTPTETERDSQREGDGPLYVDPEDPQAFIPRQ